MKTKQSRHWLWLQMACMVFKTRPVHLFSEDKGETDPAMTNTYSHTGNSTTGHMSVSIEWPYQTLSAHCCFPTTHRRKFIGTSCSRRITSAVICAVMHFNVFSARPYEAQQAKRWCDKQQLNSYSKICQTVNSLCWHKIKLFVLFKKKHCC